MLCSAIEREVPLQFTGILSITSTIVGSAQALMLILSIVALMVAVLRVSARSAFVAFVASVLLVALSFGVHTMFSQWLELDAARGDKFHAIVGIIGLILAVLTFFLARSIREYRKASHATS